MRPGFINAAKLDQAQTSRVVDWMHANGLRYYVPWDARIVVTGNRFRVETYDIERIIPRPAGRWPGQHRTWYHARTDRWFRNHDRKSLPTRVRTYRIRYPLKDFK